MQTGAVVVMIVWSLDLQLHVQSMPITTKVVRSNPVYSIQYYVIRFVKLSVTGRWFSQSTPVSSTNKIDCHDITEILLKVALSTINQTWCRHARVFHMWVKCQPLHITGQNTSITCISHPPFLILHITHFSIATSFYFILNTTPLEQSSHCSYHLGNRIYTWNERLVSRQHHIFYTRFYLHSLWSNPSDTLQE